MKPIPQRALPILQTDMFDAPAASATLTSLQRHQDELVELLSQLLWQVVRHADVAQRLENDDE